VKSILMQKTSDMFLRHLDKINQGALNIQMPNGHSYQFGQPANQNPVHLVIKDWGVINNLIRKGDTGFAEDYRQGLWDTSDLTSLLTIGLLNEKAVDSMINGQKLHQILARISYLFKRNTVDGSKRNIHAHYDLGNDFYSLWLDKTMTYSSAIFKDEQESLEQAQFRKYDRIVERFDRQNPSVLEIGCGWGGFADRCSETQSGADISGVTISDEQYDFAAHRVQGRASILKRDYRLLDGQYDNIVSIEMFEAVGQEYWSTYFNKIKSLLKSKGSALIQTITIADDKFESYRKGSDVIRSLIFPGGMLPSPAVFEQTAAQSNLKMTDRYEFGLDYARTLEIWLNNFDAAYVDIKKLGYDDGFIRLWRFYLASCIAGFRTGRIDVMQAELKHA
jgi:cyclopropane-fatty-acyl-phospholipid synthase